MGKRGPKIKQDEKMTEYISIALTPSVSDALTARAQAAGFNWRGGTVDYARRLLEAALNSQLSSLGAADPYSNPTPPSTEVHRGDT